MKTRLLLAILFLLLPQIILAAGVDILGGVRKTGEALYGSDARPVDPQILIANIVQIVLGFVGLIFILLLLYAGFRWMTSQGNEQAIEEAKNTIRSTVIGLVLILTAYSIAGFISSSLEQAVR